MRSGPNLWPVSRLIPKENSNVTDIMFSKF